MGTRVLFKRACTACKKKKLAKNEGYEYNVKT